MFAKDYKMARKFNLKPLPPVGITDTHKRMSHFVLFCWSLLTGQKIALKGEVVGVGA